MDTLIKGDKPHYFLYVDTARDNGSGQWQFTLKHANGTNQFRVSDMEPGVTGERLELLTIVRALESLDQPSRITLNSCDSYIRQGIQYNIYEWRSNNWLWEFFGYMVPIKHADLWQRIDHLLHVHAVECRKWRFDTPHRRLAGPISNKTQTSKWSIRVAAGNWLKYAGRIMPHTLRHGLNMAAQYMRQRLADLKPSSSY
jgi:ribonuclease HI